MNAKIAKLRSDDVPCLRATRSGGTIIVAHLRSFACWRVANCAAEARNALRQCTLASRNFANFAF